MKKVLIATAAILVLGISAVSAQADSKGKMDPKAQFEKHCASCHKDGGNTINPAKTLKKASLEKNGIKNWKDIVEKMRHPGPGMTKFEIKDISDKEAKTIAQYIQKAFR